MWLRSLGLLALCSLANCAVAPNVPGGPLQGAALQLGAQMVVPATPADVTLRSSVDGSERDTSQSGASPGLRFAGRAGVIDWLDLAADLGAYDAGVEVRVGLPEGSEPLPLALSWGYRTRGPIEDGPSDRKRREWRLRLEAYPLLYAEDRTRLHGILTGGASFGVRYHEIQLPSSFDDGDWGADELGSTNLSFLRDESRLEAALGVDLRVARRRPDGTTRWGGAYSFVAMPYWSFERASRTTRAVTTAGSGRLWDTHRTSASSSS